MRGIRRIAESAAVFGMVCVLAIGAAVSETGEVSGTEENGQNLDLRDTGTAGIASVLNGYQLSMAEEEDYYISVEKRYRNVVSASAEESEDTVEGSEVVVEEDSVEEPEVIAEDAKEDEEPQLTEEEKEWLDYLMADVEVNLNVREDVSEDAEIVGKMYRGDRARILETSGDWIKISSGNVEGYVLGKYCITGVAALNFAKENCDTIATVTSSKSLRVRKGQSTQSSIVKTVQKGDVLTVDTSAGTEDGWIAVLVGDTTCYVSADYVDVSLKIGTAVTLAEEEAAQKAAEEAARKAEEEAKKEAEKKNQASVTTTQGSAVAASTDEVTLLAALIYCEAGGESYECQLGVGAVVINRIKSGSFPNNLYDVIYQKGQFGPAMTGKLERRLNSGVSSSCIKAAEEALSGTDNTGGCLYFNSTSCGHSGLTIGRIVFW